MQFWIHSELALGKNTNTENLQFSTQLKCSFQHIAWLRFFRVYKGTESLSPMAISLALNHQWQLQLSLNSPMAVAICLLAGKSWSPLPPEKGWKSNPTLKRPGTRQFDWRFPLHVHIATLSGESFICMCISPLLVANPVTSSKPASPTGGLLAPCMRLRRKQPPWINCFKTTPCGEKVFKTTPNEKICPNNSLQLSASII